MIIKREDVTPYEFEGLAVFDYTAGAQANASLALIHVPPGGAHREAYSISADKYFLVTRGRVLFSLDGQWQELGEGDLCVALKNRPYAYKNQTMEPATLALFHTPPFRMEDERFT
ncbi:MAG: cupin domain-containing protein [Chloroflexi bacterium]|nr:cupin domain-containing protein [Chloroflexota bacterium]